MKKLTATMLTLSLIVCGFAQTALGTPTQPVTKRPAHRRAASTMNVQAVTAVQTDLVAAIQSMSSALPIYDGNRVKSIHAAHHALEMVDRALNGPNAAARPKPTVKDTVKSKKAASKYSQAQIAASQASMKQGLASLQQALTDLNTAAGATPSKRAQKCAQLINTAINEANTAIALHGN